MQLQAHYDPRQDRVLLRRGGESHGDLVALWLTRRQLVALAAACQRAVAAEPTERDADERPARTAAAAVKSGRSVQPEARLAAESAKLVTGIRFRRVPGGLRIELSSTGVAPLVLAFKGAQLSAFAALLVRIATRARWDIDGALARAGATDDVPIRMLH